MARKTMAGQNILFEIRYIDRVIGMFFLVALVLGSGALFFKFKDTNRLGERVSYYTISDNSYGVSRGGPIRLSGIRIGDVRSVGLQGDAKVRVDVDIYARYQQFVTEGSFFAVETSYGLERIIGGGLEFLPGPENAPLLPAEGLIPIEKPMDIKTLIDELGVEETVDDVRKILNNTAEITDRLKEEQGALFMTLDNIQRLSADLGKITPGMSDVIEELRLSMTGLNRSIDQVNELIVAYSDDISLVLSGAEQVTKDASALLVDVNNQLPDLIANINQTVLIAQQVVRSVEEGSDNIPPMLSEGAELVRNTAEISDKINRHWLLGGSPPQQVPWRGIGTPLSSPYSKEREEGDDRD